MFGRRPALPDLLNAPLTPEQVLESAAVLRRVVALGGTDTAKSGNYEALRLLRGLEDDTLLRTLATWAQLTAKVCTPAVARHLPLAPFLGPDHPWAPARVAMLPPAVIHAGDDTLLDVWATPASAALVPNVSLDALLPLSQAVSSVVGVYSLTLGKQGEDFIVSVEKDVLFALSPSRWPMLNMNDLWRVDLLHLPMMALQVSPKDAERFTAATPDCIYTARYPSTAAQGSARLVNKGSIRANVQRQFWIGHLAGAFSNLVDRLGEELLYGARTHTPGSPPMLFDPLPTPWSTAPYARIEVLQTVDAAWGGLSGGRTPLVAAADSLKSGPTATVVVAGDRHLQILLPLPVRALGTLEDILLAHSRMLAASLLDLPDLNPSASGVLRSWVDGAADFQKEIPRSVDGVVRLAANASFEWVQAPPSSVLLAP